MQGHTKTRKVKQISQLEHVKTKSMWIGSKQSQEVSLYLYNDGKMVEERVRFTPGLYKIIDEITTNAIDHYTNYPDKVTEINLSFDDNTGRITVINNGPGIVVEKTKTLDGVEMYTPQMIASVFLSGDNLDEDKTRITGGTNGAGLKLTNAFSSHLELKTYDATHNVLYTQVFMNQLSIINPPTITKGNRKNGYTRISFIPAYDQLGYEGGYNIERDAKVLSKLIQTRAYQTAAFTSCKVKYNGELVVFTAGKKNAFVDFVKMFTVDNGNDIFSTKLKQNGDGGLDLDVCVTASSGKFQHFSLINGIYVYNGGTHVKYIKKLLMDGLKPYAEKALKAMSVKFNPNMVSNSLSVFIRGYIASPDFSSQIKDNISTPIDNFNCYRFTDTDFKKIWAMNEYNIIGVFIDKNSDKKQQKTIRGKVNVPKCTDAKFAGDRKKWKKCIMFVCEGDSAMGTVHNAIVSKESKLGGYDYYGTFSIQGVPMNARREIKFVTNKKTKETKRIIKAKLKNNERLTSLMKVIGLDYAKTYERTEEGEKEFNTLRYAKIISATDQDEDGKGNIFGLLMNFIALFWPALIDRGFLSRLNTPIVRAFPKDKKKVIKEFDTLPYYRRWVEENYGGDEEKVSSQYRIAYYKGLGTHKKHFIPRMFQHLDRKIATITLDEKAIENLDIYYGAKPDPRKLVLRTPDVIESNEKTLSVSDQLGGPTKSYMVDNVRRKMPHLIDGFKLSGRDIAYGAMKIFAKSNNEMKLEIFVNRVCIETLYPHGAASLCQTAARMAQSFPSAMNLPFIYDDGNYGTRKMGGCDFASPRYTETHLNKKLFFAMFPQDDFELLPQRFDEGKHLGPQYFCPILPMSILENVSLPATGWSIDIYARDIDEVFKNVRDMINGEITKPRPMKIWLNNMKCKIIKWKGKQWSVGRYSFNSKTCELTVTELPYGICSSMLVGERANPKSKHSIINNIGYLDATDSTSDESVNIVIQIDSREVENIKKKYTVDGSPFDYWETWLNLKTDLTNHINMIGVDNSVIEYKKYEDVLADWYPVRKDMYKNRINRKIVLCNLRIEMIVAILKFADNKDSYGIGSTTTTEEYNKILNDNGYEKYDDNLLSNPGFTETKKLRQLIMGRIEGHKASYDYLMNLRFRDTTKEACDKWKKKLDTLRAEKDILVADTRESFVGMNTWLDELNKLENVIRLGLIHGWRYGEERHDKFEE